MIDQTIVTLIKKHPGFIAALDRSDRSTPGALRQYGIPDGSYQTTDEMHQIIHDMRARMILSSSFSAEYVFGLIMYKDSMDRKIQGKYMPNYLWENKGIVPFLKIDQGLSPLQDGVQLMSELTEFDDLIQRAKNFPIFGLKFRSMIREDNEQGINNIVDQQIEVALKVYQAGFIPILEPNVDLHSPKKLEAEKLLKKVLLEKIKDMPLDMPIILKLTLPEIPDFYHDLLDHPQVIRILAASSGLRQTEADKKLSQNHDMIASFSRALTEGLSYQESNMEYDFHLKQAIQHIYDASNT